MPQENEILFNEEEFADIIIKLSELNHNAKSAQMKVMQIDWDDAKKKFEKYLKKLKKFAEESRADQLNLQVTIGWPPGINLGLTFTLPGQ